MASQTLTAPQDSTVDLAPGAGQGIVRKLAQTVLARPDFMGLLEDALISSLKAENKVFDKEQGVLVTYPDAKTRLAALLGILAQFEGDPVKRILHQHVGTPGGAQDELAETLSASPALRGAVERALRKADKTAQAAEAAEAIDV